MGFDISFDALLNYLSYTFLPLDDKIRLSHTPPLLSMYITRRCNLNCSYCIVGKTPRNLDEKFFDLTPNKYYEILQHPLIKKSLLVNFCGGEPLLNQHIFEFITMTKKQKKLTGMLTNGTLLKENWDKLLKVGIDDIQVSIYDNTVDLFGEDLKFINRDKKLNASYVLLKSDFEENQDKFEKIINFVDTSNFKSLKINFCLSNKHNVFFNEMLQEENIEQYIKFKKRILKKYTNITIYFPDIVSRDKIAKKKCKIPWSILHLDAAGNFGFCCKHQPDISIINRNIFKNDWEKIINSEEFCKYRADLLLSKNIIPIQCINCYHLYGSYSSNI